MVAATKTTVRQRAAAKAEALAKVKQGIDFLCGQCDWAQTWDGAGFAKNDTVIGHELHEIPLGEWTDEMLAWGYAKCYKYREQLQRAFGLDFYATIPYVPEVQVAGERWWEARRRVAAEKLRAETETAQQRQQRERQEAWEAEKARRAARDAEELTKPRKVTLIDKGRRVRFDYPFVWGSDITNAAMAAIKALPSRQFNGTNEADKHWEAPVVALNAAPIMALGREGWELGADVAASFRALGVQARTQAEREGRNRVESKAEDADFHVAGLLREPYPFQRAGIRFAVREKRVLIADQPGLGKTIQAIGTVHHLKSRRVAVVCPAAVKYNWQREFHMTVAGKRVTVIDGKKALTLPEYRNTDVVVINYDILGAHLIALVEEFRPDAVIIDESHYIKNKKADRTANVLALMKNDQPTGVPVRLLLSGTPVLNKPLDLMSQLEALDRLKDVAFDPRGRWSPNWYFLQTYCGAEETGHGWDFSGASNTTELHDRLISTCMIRREKMKVLKELPPKTTSLIEVDLTNRAEYDRAEKGLIQFLAGAAVEDPAFRASIAGLDEEGRRKARLQRFEDTVTTAKKAEMLVRFNALRQLAMKGKLKAIKAWATDFLESGEKLVTMAWHREAVLALAQEFDAPTIMGGVSGLKKQAAVDAFQSPTGPNVIACNMIAAGEGITLTASSNTLFCELGWNPGKMEQAEDRIHRIGQKAEAVNIHYMLARRSIDTIFWNLIRTKKYVVDAVTDGKEYDESNDTSMLGDLVQAYLDLGDGGREAA